MSGRNLLIVLLFVFSSLARAGEVLPALKGNLVNHYTFDNPEGNDPKSSVELDLGADKVNINLLNGAPRVMDGAWSGSKYSLECGQKSGKPNDDWKAGIMYKSSAESKLHGLQNVSGATVMGWFKTLTGPDESPSLNTNTENPTDRYNAIGLAGILRGDQSMPGLHGHQVRALLEIIDGKVTGMGRPLDSVNASGRLGSADPWYVVMPVGQWVHLAATFDFPAGKIALYKNGKPLASGEPNVTAWQSKPDIRTSDTAAGGIKIGGSYPDNSQEFNPFNGRIDELMFFNKALTAEEVAAQFKLISDPAPATQPSRGIVQ